MASIICAHALSILLVGGLRFGPSAVLPGAGELAWLISIAVLALGMAVSLGLESRRGLAPWHSRGRLALWVVFPGAAAISAFKAKAQGCPELTGFQILGPEDTILG